MRKIVEDVIANEKKNKSKKTKKKTDKKTKTKSKTKRKVSLNDSLTRQTISRNVNDRELEEVLSGLTTNIKVVGCGGAGTNTISRCVASQITGADLVAINTDAQHLLLAESPKKVLIGRHLTRGLGAGSLPQIGEEAAKESEQDVRNALGRSDMVFVTCGLGGGTGTGSAPIIAQIAKESGALTIGVVTLPFSVEGLIRMENAEQGLKRLRDICDTVIVLSLIHI